jgi:hypothetical protein
MAKLNPLGVEALELTDDDWDDFAEALGFDERDTWDAASARLDDVNRLLRWRRELLLQIDEYDQLEQAELERLRAARDRAVGPATRTVHWIDWQLDDFAVAAYRLNGKTRWATPNGIISSRSVTHEINVIDATVIGSWPDEYNGGPTVIEEQPKVIMKPLRKHLDALVAAGKLRRIVLAGDPTDPERSEFVDEKEGWNREFADDERGYWMINDGPRDGNLLPGVQWSPKGDGGSGRNFHLDPLDEPEDDYQQVPSPTWAEWQAGATR